MLKGAGIYRAPRHVQLAWANNPALHKLLSSAGGKARVRALLKAKKPNPPKQLEFNFPRATPASALNPPLTPEQAAEGFRLIRAMLQKEGKLAKFSHLKTAKSYELIQLIEAKKKSDARDFTGKNHIIQTLTHKYPQNFKVDSRLNRAYVGLTHTPTGFKIHAPKKILPAEILK
jgi:hypothetical protein